MQALPMITPSVVKNARILLAHRASSATIQVSLRSIMRILAAITIQTLQNFSGLLRSVYGDPGSAYFLCTLLYASSTILLCGSRLRDFLYSSADSEYRFSDSYNLPSHSRARACGGTSELSGTVAR